MKCYRIRKKPEFKTEIDLDFYGGVYDTLSGAKSALSNRSSRYINSCGKEKFEIVEYDMTEVRVI